MTTKAQPVRPAVPPAFGRETAAAVLDVITNFPDLHNQASWEEDFGSPGHCGTTRCVAGWAQWLHLGKVYWTTDLWREDPSLEVEIWALQAFGLEFADGVRLFHSSERRALAALKQLATFGAIDWPAVYVAADDDEYESEDF